METIKQILPKAIATLEPATKVNPVNTAEWAKFADFQVLDDPQLQEMKYEAWRFLDDMKRDRPPRWLSLLGTSGAGKTMLAKIIWHYYRDHFHNRINWPATERTKTDSAPNGRIIRHKGGFINWGNRMNQMLGGDYSFISDVCDYPFFVIDDIASEYVKHRDLSASKLYLIGEARLKKWTVITANLSLEQIGDRLDTRLASRMLRNNSMVVDVDVPDFNLRSS